MSPRFLTLGPSFPTECFVVLKESILSFSPSVIRNWGDILMTSDLACENEESLLAVKVIDRTRNHLEKEVVQECMNISVHASNQRVFLATKTLLGSFVHYRKNKDLWNRLSELYEPVLFRSLSVANAHVRRHAVILFTDCFPLGSSESRETYSIEEQFKAILVGNRAE